MDRKGAKYPIRRIRTARHVRSKGGHWHKHLEGYLFLLPNICGFLAFTAFPVIAALTLSLFHWDLLTPPLFVAADNFRELLRDVQFHRVLWNTAYFTLGTVPLRVVLSLLLAMALNQQIRGIIVYRTIYFLPVVSSLVAVALIWQWILNGSFGLLNSLIWRVAGWIGVAANPPDWLNSIRWAMPAVMALNLWKNVGL